MCIGLRRRNIATCRPASSPRCRRSSTGGFRRRVGGVKDGSGTIVFKLDPADPITDQLNEGDAVTLLLYLDGTRHFTVPAIIEALQWEVDIDRGEIIGGTAEFAIDGAWTKPSFS